MVVKEGGAQVNPSLFSTCFLAYGRCRLSFPLFSWLGCHTHAVTFFASARPARSHNALAPLGTHLPAHSHTRSNFHANELLTDRQPEQLGGAVRTACRAVAWLGLGYTVGSALRRKPTAHLMAAKPNVTNCQCGRFQRGKGL